MTQKRTRIIELREIQKRKLEQNKKSMKKMWKHLLWLSLLVCVYVFYSIENSIITFNNITSFVIISFSILFLISAIYYLFVRYIIQKNLKEIRSINGKLYQLMKLEND